MRREGFVLTVNADGSLSQKIKNQKNKLVFDTAKMEFVDAKKK